MRASLIIKAAAAFIAGIYITFSQAHDANLAMTGLVIIATGWFFAAAVSAIKKQNPVLSVFVIVVSVSMVRFATSFDANSATSRAWTLLMALAIFFSFVEIISAIRSAKKSAARRDHLISAGLAVGLFVSQVSISAAADSVSHVGFFGAYAAILGVHLGISAASPNAQTKA